MTTLAFLMSIVFLALVENGESLRCWRCTSDVDGVCTDKLVEDLEQTYEFSLENCEGGAIPLFPYVYDSVPACVTNRIINDNGGMTTRRKCTWMYSRNKMASPCPATRITLDDEKYFCQICTSDGCNSE